MATIDVQTGWTHGSPQAKLTAKRVNDSYQEWAENHVDIVLHGGSSTDPASGSGTPLTKNIVWSHGGTEFTSTVRVFGTSTELDAAVQAMSDAITDAGGTVISVT